MDLDNLIINCFCIIDDAVKEVLKGKRLRERGPNPVMSDSEIITMEIVGEFKKLDQDKELFQYFRYHFSHLFPGLTRISRTTFVRQATNLKDIKENAWQYILNSVEHDSGIAIIDSFPIQVCQFARATRCQRFKGKAAFGKDRMVCQTFMVSGSMYLSLVMGL